MKMPEKHDLLAAIRGKGTRHRGNLRLQWRTFAAETMAVRLQKQQSTQIDVRHYRPVHSGDLLDFAGLSSNLAYITSVFIGYIGTDLDWFAIKRFAAKSRRRW